MVLSETQNANERVTPKETAVKRAFETAVNLKKTMNPQKSCLNENLQDVFRKGSNSYLYS
jgi:hypothetical protein